MKGQKSTPNTLLNSRYILPKEVYNLLDKLPLVRLFSEEGKSVLGNSIFTYAIGQGEKRVFAWSQMHGNESTTTRALLCFIKYLNEAENSNSEVQKFLNSYTLYFIPVLNPDGAIAFTRENANEVDLNRDAYHKTQPESVYLQQLFTLISPDLCLNLHDQRSIYGVSSNKPAILSFLAPSADSSRSITLSRTIAMEKIAKMNAFIQKSIPGNIGRYDDAYNENCIGDTFQKLGVPTILFEAGHYPQNYNRSKTRDVVFEAFKVLFDMYENEINTEFVVEDYFAIPENQSNYRDIVIKNVSIGAKEEVGDLILQYKEVVNGNEITYIPIVDAFSTIGEFVGHKEIDGLGACVLMNSQEKVELGKEVLQIINKNKDFDVLFSVNNPF